MPPACTDMRKLRLWRAWPPSRSSAPVLSDGVVTLERADGALGCIAGQHQAEWWTSPELARQGYRRRVRALNAAGYRRVLEIVEAQASETTPGALA